MDAGPVAVGTAAPVTDGDVEAAVWVAFGAAQDAPSGSAADIVRDTPAGGGLQRVGLPDVRPQPYDWRDSLNAYPGGDQASVQGLINGRVTHYGTSYNGRPLGCGTGMYDSRDPSIAAVSPVRYGEWPCGQLLRVCGAACLVVTRQDACPGCGGNHIDLSEAAIDAVCGAPESSTCSVTIEAIP